MATLIGNAILRSGYVGLILYAAIRVAQILVIGLLRLPKVSKFRIVRKHSSILSHRAYQLLSWGALVLWVTITLQFFTIQYPLLKQVRIILRTHILGSGLDGITVGSLLAFPLVAWASFALSKLIRFALEEEVYPAFRVGSGVSYAVSTVAHYLVLVLGFLVALNTLGITLTQFVVLFGAFGVGIGFGLQNIVNNFISGIILLFERPVKIGDKVQIDSAKGVIQRIGIRASVILADDNAEIIVPNASLISNAVTNLSRTNSNRLIEISFRVTPTTSPQQVIALLMEKAGSHPLLLSNPPPRALCTHFSAKALTFALRAWTADNDVWVQTRSELSIQIHQQLVQSKIALG